MSDSLSDAWDLGRRDPARVLALTEDLSRVGPVEQARGTAARAHALRRLGRSEEARELAESIGDADPLAAARRDVLLGSLLLDEGQYVGAATAFRRSEDAYREADDFAGVAGARTNLALVYRHLGDLPGALEALRSTLGQFSSARDTYGLAVALLNAAQIERELGDARAARVHIEQAWELTQKLDNPVFGAFVHSALGAICAADGDVDRGIVELEAAVAEARQVGAPPALAEALGSLAQVVAPTDPHRARELLAEALPHTQTAGRWTQVSAWLAMGDLATSDAERLDAFETAAGLADEGGEQALASRAHRGAAEAAAALGETEAALEHWRASATAEDRRGERRREQRLARAEISLAVQALKAEREAQRARIDELVDMERARAELLAMLAHELRNPLGSAQLAVDVLRELTIPGVDAPMQLLDASLSRIGGIVDATLADAASERGAPVLQRQRTDLDELVRAIVDEHRPGAVRKQQSLEVDGAAVTLSVDPARIFHAVGNLVSNAIKYSPRGATILVTVGEGEAGARVEIADEGPGVPEDAADELFRPFVRGPAKPTAGERSMGLGLHIARRMVELHDGTIGVRPRSDRPGAAFWFELPR